MSAFLKEKIPTNSLVLLW